MLETVRREGIYLWHYFSIQFSQIFPYWLLGAAIGSAVSVFGKRGIHRLTERLHGGKLGALGLIPASILGIASPLCMYGTIPVAASFSKVGVKDDWLAAFMMSSVLLNPQLIIYSAALGTAALIVRVLSCFICGAAAGLCVHVLYTRRGREFFTFGSFAEPQNRDIHPNLAVRLLQNILRNIRVTGPYFLLGVVLSALFQRYIPAGWITALFAGNKAFGLLMASTIGVPLYACGGGTIPLLRWWLAGGMSLGAAGAFMITGPATKITNLGALKIVLGAKRFAAYILFVMLFALATGAAVDLALR